MPYYRRRYSQRKQRAINLQLEAEQARRELYWQARREISPQFSKLKLRAFDHLMYAVISAAFSFPVVAFLFWFVFPLGPYRGRASYRVVALSYGSGVVCGGNLFSGNSD
jgi:hypothetical protein